MCAIFPPGNTAAKLGNAESAAQSARTAVFAIAGNQLDRKAIVLQFGNRRCRIRPQPLLKPKLGQAAPVSGKHDGLDRLTSAPASADLRAPNPAGRADRRSRQSAPQARIRDVRRSASNSIRDGSKTGGGFDERPRIGMAGMRSKRSRNRDCVASSMLPDPTRRGTAQRQRSRLVEHDRVDLGKALERAAVLHHDAALEQPPGRDHLHHRHRKTKRARTGDDENRNGDRQRAMQIAGCERASRQTSARP